ncbi:MAG: hypothetical protein KF773_40540 [Deltaproteobacteria bacterium]|nr:hypothetical protein [Deltaproteobacteria bacterium]MCW5805251.1 hypothetical protein [Deltaproteobacteria bacterium]
MRRLLAALLAASLCTACAHGEVPVPKTRRGWGIVTMVVGASWAVVGIGAAASNDNTVGERLGWGASGLGLGLALMTAGYYLADADP